MFCSKCGKKVEDGTKFCPSCGEKVVAKKEEKKEEVKKEEKKVVKAEPVKEAPKRKGLAIAGLILGIIAIILAWFLNIFIIVIPIVGLILAICSGKSGLKIVGIILNAVSIVVCLVMFVVSLTLIGRSIGNSVDRNLPEIKEGLKEVRDSVKSGYPYGTWTCVPYSSLNLQQYDYDNIKSNDSKDLTVLYLYSDNTYKYGPYLDSYKNYFKGNFTYKINTEKNKQYASQKLSFINIDGPMTSAMVDGVAQTITSESKIEVEMELFGQNDYDKALIGFSDGVSYNPYMCQR